MAKIEDDRPAYSTANSGHVVTDGGPAFPIVLPEEFQQAHTGLSLRDWFAGQALVGLIAQTMKAEVAEEFARQAYVTADAMLEARNK